MLLGVIFVGLRTILYILGGMSDESVSQTGLIKVWIFIIGYVILRNLIKPFFIKKMNKF